MKEIVMSQEEILFTTQKMGAEITSVLKKEDNIPVCLVVMRGAMAFAADLLKSIKTDVFMDYIHVSSYEGTSTNGVIHLHFDVQTNIKGKTVLIIEDIVDTGYSMEYLIEHLKSLGAKKVLVATLFDKVVNRVVDVPIDFVGKVLDKNQFLVGYGLDYNGLHRNVPYVFIPTEEEVASWDKELAERK
ncbi:MAG: hypoxanthine phosphoribosyltransferase [Bacilli bacterium]|nr:hypoxanthine phosphoribosyltransferase [Bacilli bacterium]